MHVKKKLISLLLALGMLGGTQTAQAAEPAAQEAAPLPAWSYGMLADGYSLGLFGDEIYTQHSQTVTTGQLDTMTKVVAGKLALLEMETRPAAEEGLVIDTTRGGVVNALYQEAAAYAFPGIEAGAEEFMTSVGALVGDGSSLRLEEPCTLLEAAAMADSLILNLYDQQNAGSLGLLWKADNGEGNTLYLLGSIHTDVNNTYPFHKQLRDIILNADQVTFELDFNDQAQIAEFAAMQVYSDGTTLADHVSPELYQATVKVPPSWEWTSRPSPSTRPGLWPPPFSPWPLWTRPPAPTPWRWTCTSTPRRPTRASPSTRWRPTPSRAASSITCPPRTRRPIWPAAC